MPAGLRGMASGPSCGPQPHGCCVQSWTGAHLALQAFNLQILLVQLVLLLLDLLQELLDSGVLGIHQGLRGEELGEPRSRTYGTEPGRMVLPVTWGKVPTLSLIHI